MEEEKDDLTLKNLGQFFGTQEYHKLPFGAIATDGVAYVMENGYSWIVTDALAVIRTKLMNEEFLSIKLKLLKDSKAKMVITDGNDRVLYTQDYGYTDAKRELDFYFIDNVMLLASEY